MKEGRKGVEMKGSDERSQYLDFNIHEQRKTETRKSLQRPYMYIKRGHESVPKKRKELDLASPESNVHFLMN